MKIYTFGPLMAAMAVGMLTASCGDTEFKIKGEAEGLDNVNLALEKADGAGSWMLIDSVHVGGNGSFSASVPAPGAPELYRLAHDGKYIYFPIDSVETLTFDIRGKEFGRNYSISGTPGAVAAARFDSLLNTLPANADAGALDAFKRRVFTEYLAPAQGSLVSYYILTKSRDGKALYDATLASDAKYFAAVATAFEQFKPNDPRTAMLKSVASQALRNARTAQGKQKVIEAPEIVSFEIARPDVNGQTRRLSELLGKGRPVILIFTALTAEKAPAYNAEIMKLHQSGRADIFMVGLDDDRYGWRNAASNLPWVNVYDEDGSRSQSLVDYNVTAIPVAFIFNSAGELIDRADDPTQIAAKIR